MRVVVSDERDHGLGEPGVDLAALRRLAEFVTAERGVPPAMELAVLCVDEATVAELNRQHMGADGPTDVLAFPIDSVDEAGGQAPTVLGDVVLCPAVAARQGTDAGHGLDAELELLLVHGILHLLGHDHAEPGERDEMFGLTERLLAQWRREATP